MAAGSTSALATWTGTNVQRTDQQDFRRSGDRTPASARPADAAGQPPVWQAGQAGRAHEEMERCPADYPIVARRRDRCPCGEECGEPRACHETKGKEW